MLYYSIDHPDPDNNFTVTVVPINGAGPGEPSAINTILSQNVFPLLVSSTIVVTTPGKLIVQWNPSIKDTPHPSIMESQL